MTLGAELRAVASGLLRVVVVREDAAPRRPQPEPRHPAAGEEFVEVHSALFSEPRAALTPDAQPMSRRGLSPPSHLNTASEISSRGSFRGPRRAHSHTVATRQPDADRVSNVCPSRRTLRPIFPVQYSLLVWGMRHAPQSCPCQKQPCTKRAARRFGKTRSGFPARPLTCSLYRSPRACRAFLRRSSGTVSPLFTAAIVRRLVSGSTLSVNSDSRLRPCRLRTQYTPHSAVALGL